MLAPYPPIAASGWRNVQWLFTPVYGPSETVPVSGIYACTGCWYEDVCIEGTIFPPENREHEHPVGECRLPVRWRLVVMPSHERSLDRYCY
jgi:hypothetical protein